MKGIINKVSLSCLFLSILFFLIIIWGPTGLGLFGKILIIFAGILPIVGFILAFFSPKGHLKIASIVGNALAICTITLFIILIAFYDVIEKSL